MNKGQLCNVAKCPRPALKTGPTCWQCAPKCVFGCGNLVRTKRTHCVDCQAKRPRCKNGCGRTVNKHGNLCYDCKPKCVLQDCNVVVAVSGNYCNAHASNCPTIGCKGRKHISESVVYCHQCLCQNFSHYIGFCLRPKIFGSSHCKDHCVSWLLTWWWYSPRTVNLSPTRLPRDILGNILRRCNLSWPIGQNKMLLQKTTSATTTTTTTNVSQQLRRLRRRM